MDAQLSPPASRFRFRPKDWWRSRSLAHQAALVILGVLLVLALVMGLVSWLRSPGSPGTTTVRSGLVAGAEAPFGKAVDRAIQTQVGPRFKGIEDAQKKTDKAVDDIGKRVTTLEIPPKPFDYELFYEYASGRKK